jgi:hypothetical protein
MKIKVESSCGLPNKKYDLGWNIDLVPGIGIMWVTEDRGECIDGYRFNTRPAFLVINVGWLFWNWSFFIEELGI